MKYSNLIFIVVVTLLSQCKPNNEENEINRISFNGEEFIVKGKILENLEEGNWEFYKKSGKLVEKGNFIKGVRVGSWKYPENKSDSLINWKEFICSRLSLRFNIPEKLLVIYDSTDYIKFSNRDSSNLFNTSISVSDTTFSDDEFDRYYQKGEEEIKLNGFRYKLKKTAFQVAGSAFQLNEYMIGGDSSEIFNVLIFSGLTKDRRLIEISVRFSPVSAVSARIIFFSIITNLFYKGERFLSPFSNY